MFIDWNTDDLKVREPRSGRVFDATGQEYTQVLSCDTETGHMQVLLESNDGKDFLHKRITAPAPLRIEWVE